MKRLLATILLGIWLCDAVSAQNYFNKRETLHSFQSQLYSVVESKGKYYTSGWGVDSINHLGGGLFLGVPGIKFTVWDKQGNILHDTTVQRADKGGMICENNTLLELPGNTFLVAAGGGDTSGHLKMFIVCFDSTAKPLWIREYDKPLCAGLNIDTHIGVRALKPDGQGNWLMLTSIKCDLAGGAFTIKTLLTKFDSGFSMIWNKVFGDDMLDSQPNGLLIDKDGYTIGCTYNNRSVASRISTIYRGELFKTDTAGNQTWHWQSKLPGMTGMGDVIRTDDGGYAYAALDGMDKRSANGQTVSLYYIPTLVKIDSSGTTLWTIHLSQALSYGYSGLYRVMQLPDGDFIGAGSIESGFDAADSNDYTFYGILIRFRRDGTIKWKRKYDYQSDTMICVVQDMKRTEDGGYVLAGYANDNFNKIGYPTLRAWLLKVDSNGCASDNDPQCWPVGVPNEPKLVVGSYRVYPNPATEQLQISYSKASNADEVFSLFDITGRKVAEMLLSGQSRTATLDISPFPSGIYSYRIITQDGSLRTSGRLVKQ